MAKRKPKPLKVVRREHMFDIQALTHVEGHKTKWGKPLFMREKFA